MSAKTTAPSFDAFRLAAAGERIGGEVDARSLPNVAEELAPGEEAVPIAWSIAGGRTVDGRPSLSIGMEGRVPLVCQRCLAAFDWPVSQRTEVVLAKDEAALHALDAELEGEVVLAQGALDALELVEDELVLTLPFAPRHEGECPAATLAR